MWAKILHQTTSLGSVMGPANSAAESRIWRFRGVLWLAACVTLLVLPLGGCEVFGHTVLASHTLPWVGALLPTAGSEDGEKHSTVVAAGSVDRLYDCLTPATGTPVPPQLWVTDDRAQHWRHVSDVPTPGSVGGGQAHWECLLIADDLDGARLLVTLLPAGAAPNYTTEPGVSYLSADSGASWRAVPNVDGMRVLQLATRQGLTYARRVVGAPNGVGTSTLSVSTDGLQSWRAADTEIQRDSHHDPTIPFIRAFVLRAADGVLLVNSDYLIGSGTTITPTSTLWRSADGGAHWSRAPLPDDQRSIVASPDVGANPAAICSVPTREGAEAYCSSDGGANWRVLPQPHSAKHPTRVASPFAFALTRGGDVLAWVSDRTEADEGPDGTSFQRLRAGASAWEIVEAELNDPGPIDTLYAATAGDEVLWRLRPPLTQVVGDPNHSGRRIYSLPYSAIA